MITLLDLEMTTGELLGTDITSELPIEMWANNTYLTDDDPMRLAYRMMSVVGCYGNYIRDGY